MKTENSNLIMVVDDTLDSLRFIQSALKKYGYTVSIANNGEKAIRRAKTAKPDLILLDIVMPGMDGYKTCEYLREDTATQNIPIIFMSSLSDTFDKVKAFGCGAVDYLSKPIEIEELLARVKTHISISCLQRKLLEINNRLEYKVKERTSELFESNSKLKKEIQEKIIVEKELSERATRLELVSNIAKKTASILEVNELLQQMVNLIQSTFGYHNVEILLVNGDYLFLSSHCELSYGKNREIKCLKIGEEGITGWVAKHATPLNIPDVNKDKRYIPTWADNRIRSEMAVPIFVKEEVIGVINIESALPNAFEEIDIFTLQTIADQLAVGIINAQLFEARENEIKERISAEEKLAIFRMLVESSGQGICMINMKKEIIYINPTLCDILELNEPIEIVNAFVGEIYSESARSSIEDNIFQLVLEKGQWKGESTLITRSKKYVPIIENIFLIKDQNKNPIVFVIMITDISIRKEAEIALKESEAKYRCLVEWANEGIIIIQKGKIKFANKAFYQIFKINNNNSSKRTIEELIHPKSLQKLRESLAKSEEFNNSQSIFEIELVRSDEQIFSTEINVGKITYEGESAYLIFLRDITERKRAQEAQVLAERANRFASLSTLTAGISHEINQPLTALKVEVDGLLYLKGRQSLDIPENVNDSLKFISLEAEKIDEIIKHMRSLTRQEKVQPQWLKLNDVTIEALSYLDKQLKSYDVELETRFCEDCSGIFAQKTAVEQIIINIVSNALHALNNSNSKEKKIIVTIDKNEKYYSLKIMDNGPGIPEENIERIFDPFFTTSTDESGQGLGLSIVQNLVNTMGGKITVSNHAQGGAIFNIYFPYSEIQEEENESTFS